MSDKLAEAFSQLCAVVRPRPDMTEGNIEAGARRLYRVLSEYPEDVAFWALDYWPRHSEWFPTEHELRAVCDRRVGELARDEAAHGEPSKGRFLEPIGKTAYFVDRVRRVHGDGFYKSWLAGGITCMFSNDTVYTTAIGVERLRRECMAQMQEAGVIAVHSKEASEMLERYCDQNQLSFEGKKRGHGR